MSKIMGPAPLKRASAFHVFLAELDKSSEKSARMLPRT